MDGSVVIKAVLETAEVTKGVKGIKDSLEGVSWEGITKGDKAAQNLSGSLKSAGTAATVGLTTPIIAAGTAAMATASTYEQATAKIQSALGLTAEEAERLGDVGASIYEDGFGESLDAVTDALITVRQNLGDLNDADLSYVTEGVMTLSDTLGMDTTESIRGVNALMDGFGLSAQEAMDLFVAGAQNGLNYSDELGDNLAEYGPRFAQMGFSAEEYFSILQAGAENGAYSLDKVNDFLNEFQTSLSDGRMDEAIGNFSQSTQELFQSWKDGGATGQQVFEAVLGELAKMPDGYEKAQIASELWSSLGEDNAMGMLDSLAGVENKYGDVAGAAEEAGNAASDTFAGKMQSALRELQGAIEPLGEPLLNIATKVAEVVKGFGEWFAGIGEGGQTAVLVIAGILAAIGPILSIAGQIVAIMPAISSALSGASTGAGLLSGAVSALSGAFTVLSGPVGIVLGVIAALAGFFAYLWQTNEQFRTSVTDAWNQIMTVLGECWAAIQPVLQQFVDALMNLLTTIGNIVSQVVSMILPVIVPILTTLLQTVTTVFAGILSTVSNVMGSVQQVIQGAWDIISGIFETVLGLIYGIVTGDFSMMQDGISSIMSGIQGVISGAWNAISGVISGVLDTIAGVVTSIWNGIRDTICGVLDAISEATGVDLNGIKDTVTNVFNGIRDTASNIWNGIKDTISRAINGAKDTVSNVVDRIAGIFSGLKIKWPHIPLPHLSISGSFSLIPPSVPKVSISWYAKGGVFNGPSVIGVGEAGPEAVVPFNKRGAQPLAEGIADALGRKGGSDTGVTIVIENFNNYDTGTDVDALMREIGRRVKVKQRAGGFA